MVIHAYKCNGKHIMSYETYILPRKGDILVDEHKYHSVTYCVKDVYIYPERDYIDISLEDCSETETLFLHLMDMEDN